MFYVYYKQTTFIVFDEIDATDKKILYPLRKIHHNTDTISYSYLMPWIYEHLKLF